MCSNKINSDIKCLNLNQAEYALFLSKRLKRFERIADSGYGLSWFAQCFYLYWQDKIKIDGLELWGNMGPHFNTQRTSQFSEVMVGQEHYEYKSNIFIVTVLGVEKRMRRELRELKKHIYKTEMVLPFKVFMIKFDNLAKSESDPVAIDPNVLFQGTKWVPSSKATLWGKSYLISIGCLQNSFQI